MDRFILIIESAVILGSFGGRIVARLRIPQVVGYIIIGILAIFIGGVWFHSIGGKLKKEVFQSGDSS